MLTWILVVTVSVAATLAAAELGYRFYVLDFYGPELRAYNPADILDSPQPADLLVMGDSFSAGQQSYVNELRLLLPGCRIANGAVPGSGILEANILAPTLFERYHPKVLVYQLYVGNDLINLRYPKNWSALPWLRNVFWLLADHFKILSYLNYRLGQVRRSWADADSMISAETQSTDSFSVEDYPSHMKNYLKADSRILEKQIVVEGDRAADFAVLTLALRDLLANCRHGSCSALLLVIPDAVQVGAVYLEDMMQLGAEFVRPHRSLHAESYPFVTQLEHVFDQNAPIKVVNVLKPLQEAQRAGAKVYFRNDPHLAPAGQQVVAEELARELRDEDLDCVPRRMHSAADVGDPERRQR